jgi:CRP-like cAMP-binding protein
MMVLNQIRLERGDELFSAGSPCNRGMYIVSRGKVGIFNVSSSHALCTAGPGESLCEFSLIGRYAGSTAKATFAVSVQAIKYSEVYFLSR